MKEYIERETFIESQQHLYCDNCARRKDGKGKIVYDIGEAPCRACEIMDVLDAADDFPAADVRPVVRGENITEENPVDQFICSKCGLILEGYHRREIDDDEGFEIYYEFKPNFCPNCGADMRGNA